MSIDATQHLPFPVQRVARGTGARTVGRFAVRAVGIALLPLLVALVGVPVALAHGGARSAEKAGSTSSNEVKSRSNHVRMPGASLNRESSEESGGGDAGAAHTMHMRLPHDMDFQGPSSNHSVGVYRGGTEPPAPKPVGSNENGPVNKGSGAPPAARPAGAAPRGGA